MAEAGIAIYSSGSHKYTSTSSFTILNACLLIQLIALHRCILHLSKTRPASTRVRNPSESWYSCVAPARATSAEPNRAPPSRFLALPPLSGGKLSAHEDGGGGARRPSLELWRGGRKAVADERRRRRGSWRRSRRHHDSRRSWIVARRARRGEAWRGREAVAAKRRRRRRSAAASSRRESGGARASAAAVAAARCWRGKRCPDPRSGPGSEDGNSRNSGGGNGRAVSADLDAGGS